MNRKKHVPCEVEGIAMRSTLEGRWATFFSKAGFKWQYEPRSFKMPDGRKYTPDFHVENLGWLEIKPTLAHLRESWIRLKPVLKLYPEETFYLLPGDRVYFRDVVRFHRGVVFRPNVRTMLSLLVLIRRGPNSNLEYETLFAGLNAAMQIANNVKISHTLRLVDCARFDYWDCETKP